jgi:hypothetical protein
LKGSYAPHSSQEKGAHQWNGGTRENTRVSKEAEAKGAGSIIVVSRGKKRGGRIS